MYSRQVLAASPGNDRMVYLMGAIREGSMAFHEARVHRHCGLRRDHGDPDLRTSRLGKAIGAPLHTSSARSFQQACGIHRLCASPLQRTLEPLRQLRLRRDGCKALPLHSVGEPSWGSPLPDLVSLGFATRRLLLQGCTRPDDDWVNIVTAIGLGGILDRSLRSCWWRYLHEGCRRRRRPGRQGRSWHP